jgi:1-aminocyclopropane-1-carboxylate deaminase/D-cysteine desulfhydrase-like pyridoxal-dependent ACC family enzyme
MPEAAVGIEELGCEVMDFISKEKTGQISWRIVVESGTGATALFLHRYLQSHCNGMDIKVIAVACAGSGAYLQEQMRVLDDSAGQLGSFPEVMFVDMQRVFAKPYKEHIELWHKLQEQTGIRFDLIYAPRAFEQLLHSFNTEAAQWQRSEVMYVHCGGVNGNQSQLKRYQRNELY